MDMPLLTLEIRLEPDVVLARQRARQVAGLLGFSTLDQARIATATSEIARNAFQYAGGGRVEFLVEPGPPPGLVVRVRERGPGIKDLQSILAGEYESSTGLGLGIVGARRLMDRFMIEPEAGRGMRVSMAKSLTGRAAPFSPQELARLSEELTRQAPQGLLGELQAQNQELLRTLEELRDRQAEIIDLHARELEETNRGVVALYAELDENEKALRRISDLKSRFLSNMSHEFRSPLNSILSLCGFLLGRTDGDLNPEQVKQVTFIRRAAESLSALVNDLLDLARVEAGKAVVRPEHFEVSGLFDTLKGTTRPIVSLASVALVFDDPAGVPPLFTDLGKVTQVLRNFLSNAVKFTERGEIRVSARPGPGDSVIFSVADTGIGIAPGDLRRIFEEFGQVENPIQRQVQGTGLGLPLARKLAELLGGSVSVRSKPGAGSTFTMVIPRVYRVAEAAPPAPREAAAPATVRPPVLIVEDDPEALATYEKFLEGAGFHALPAWTLNEARRILQGVRPSAVVLDVHLEGESGWTLLREMKAEPTLRDIPVLVLSGIPDEAEARALGADEFCLKPVPQGWLVERLRALEARGPRETILVIDDEEGARYLVRQRLSGLGRFSVVEAAGGREGLRRAREERPDAIFLDLGLPDIPGDEVLARLKADPFTAGIPVVIHTSSVLGEHERNRLAPITTAILSKGIVESREALVQFREALIKSGLEPDRASSES